MSSDYAFLIQKWGAGYFEINSLGNVGVKPDPQKKSGDLYHLVQSLVAKGIEAPILIRFDGIIRNRIHTLCSAFESAIQACNYRNVHRMVYPIKVNPQYHVIEVIRQAGQTYNVGLEVGSKPELIAVLAAEDNPESLLICNGYKDVEYIYLALMASKLGRRALIVIEQAYELNLVLETAKRLEIEPEIGFRMKLATTGSGHWISSGGEHSKFGLSSHEIISCVEILQKEEKAHWVKLLHFHVGSQITRISSIRAAINEGSRMYTELAKFLPNLNYLDIGGGLAVDYDGSESAGDSSMNYTLEEYARDVVEEIGQACMVAGVKDPVIITESGRSLVSHHSVFITEVIDANFIDSPLLEEKMESTHPIIHSLEDINENLSASNCREIFHDVLEFKKRIVEEFLYGKMPLKERAHAEKKIKLILVKIRNLYKQNKLNGEELPEINKILLETYFCNFSVFQSLPDSWAINQLFPVMPIHRLLEPPKHETVLADLTCDSDGKIDKFIGHMRINESIKLHEYDGAPYYLGIFLVGAYQEILGGLHNLFGDANVVHAVLDEKDEWEFSRLVEGNTIQEVLQYVQYDPKKLMEQMHDLLERSLKSQRITLAEAAAAKKKFKKALESYTYLVVE